MRVERIRANIFTKFNERPFIVADFLRVNVVHIIPIGLANGTFRKERCFCPVVYVLSGACFSFRFAVSRC